MQIADSALIIRRYGRVQAAPESGQTGTNLLDPDQEFFSVGSTDLNEEEARRILQEHFPRTPSTDLKFRKLFRRNGHHRGLVEFARTVARQPERFFCYLVDKKFATLTKLVDWSIEPLLSGQGYDWYEGDYGRRWVNMLYFALTEIVGPPYLDEVTSLYGHFSENPDATTLAEMQSRYDELGESGPEALQPFMTLIADGVRSTLAENQLGSHCRFAQLAKEIRLSLRRFRYAILSEASSLGPGLVN